MKNSLCIQSKFIVVSPERVLQPGRITIRDGRVLEVRQGKGEKSGEADIDLGETVLLPGLVNAHTHLEFSDLQTPFAAGENFASWISQVVSYRMRRSEESGAHRNQLVDAKAKADRLSSSILQGLRESFFAGVAMLGDIVTPPWRPTCLPTQASFVQHLQHSAPTPARQFSTPQLAPQQWAHLAPVSYPTVLPFMEILGVQAERFEASWRWGEETRTQIEQGTAGRYGLSPHAPYSIHFTSAQRRFTQLATATAVAMHVAESPAEIEWLQKERGPFRDLYERLGIADQASPPTIEQCLELLARFRRSLLIHGNYLTSIQWEQIATAPGITVVFCPRTHAHFGHDRYPLGRIQQAGIRIALGTDSRASNPDLRLWDEVVQVKRLYPETPAAKLLEWVTRGPAWGLGVDRDFGGLAPGQLANINAIPAQAGWTANNLLEELVQLTTAELKLTPLSYYLHTPSD